MAPRSGANGKLTVQSSSDPQGAPVRADDGKEVTSLIHLGFLEGRLLAHELRQCCIDTAMGHIAETT